MFVLRAVLITLLALSWIFNDFINYVTSVTEVYRYEIFVPPLTMPQRKTSIAGLRLPQMLDNEVKMKIIIIL